MHDLAAMMALPRHKHSCIACISTNRDRFDSSDIFYKISCILYLVSFESGISYATYGTTQPAVHIAIGYFDGVWPICYLKSDCRV